MRTESKFLVEYFNITWARSCFTSAKRLIAVMPITDG